MHAFKLLAVALIAMAFGASDAAAQQRPAPFVDHFRTLDSTRWRVSDGWSNGDWISNDWRARQVAFGANGAIISLSPQRGASKPFSSGELQTHGVYQHGYFEARLQAPRGSGLVTGFFTYTREGGDEGTWDEIDIEILGRDTRSVQLTYYRSGAKRFVIVPLGFDAAAGLHSYAFDWQADRIRWFVDGRVVHEETGDGLPLPVREQRLYLNLWNSASLRDWVGPIRGSGPWRLRVSCIAQAEHAPERPLC